MPRARRDLTSWRTGERSSESAGSLDPVHFLPLVESAFPNWRLSQLICGVEARGDLVPRRSSSRRSACWACYSCFL